MTLPITGERTVPGVPHENYWFRRHEIAYHAAAGLCRNATVLDAGCGEGYGAALVRGAGAARVVAVDYDATAIAHARRVHGLTAVQANVVALPFLSETFDAVLSLQTIEHLWDQLAFLADCVRVLRPGGRLVVTTPNRLTFPLGNLFHTRELNAGEIVALAESAGLRVESVLGVHHGPRLSTYPGNLVADQLASEPDTWPRRLARLVESVSADDFVLSASAVDRCLDLYLVASRQ